MKPQLLILTVILSAISACSPSPYYSGNKNGLAPGVIPRDSSGRPVVNGQTIDYLLPPSDTVALHVDVQSNENGSFAEANTSSGQVIYFDDLSYANKAAQKSSRTGYATSSGKNDW